MHDLLITSGVYALTGREVTTDTVAALLTILGYSLYDTIIVFDRVRENIPRMPRAAFSQVVNRSMSEVLTRSIATTSCTLLPIIALLLFGGSTLQDFAFALLIGVASGAYSSIFIASPVLTHWKEREHVYRLRRHRIEEEFGYVPAYAGDAADVEPSRRQARRTGRLTTPDEQTVSAAEFEQMKRDIAEEEREPSRQTSTLTKRLSHTPPAKAPARKPPKAVTPPRPRPGDARPSDARPGDVRPGDVRPGDARVADGADGGARPDGADGGTGDEFTRAPDVAENEGVSPVPRPKRPPKSRQRNRRHGRPR
jgi:SecD/SecF fusion protein